MVEAKEGKVDVDFFKNMIQSKEETEYKAGLSGIGGYSYKVDHLSGWFINFFAYISKGTEIIILLRMSIYLFYILKNCLIKNLLFLLKL